MALNGEYVLQFVRGRDEPCPVCAYNLRDLVVPRCPECGVALKLRVTLAEPRLARWLAMLVPSLFVSGLGVLFATLILVFDRPPPTRFAPPIYLTLLLSPAAFLLLALRRRLSRLPDALQSCLALVVAVIALAVITWDVVVLK